MIFSATGLSGAFRIDLERLEDERGFFARSWCASEARVHGLVVDVEQCNVSFNRRRGTLRGMHYQDAPHAEAKLVRCTQGAAFDVILDIRVGSPTFGRWEAFELTAANRTAIFVPAGFAHGFQTLADDTEMFYQMSTPYDPHAARGIRWDDPAFQIEWPLASPIVSPRDAGFPDFVP